jgi:hypothetical protein
MLLRRLSFALAFALILAFAAQSCLAGGGPVPAQGRFRAVRQARAQAWRQRAQARREGARPNRPADAKGARQPGANANRPASEGGVARPPNQDLFNPNPNVASHLPPGAVQRLRDMSPEQQERFLRNNQRFQSLPPQQQARIRQNLQRWNNLSPAEKDRLSHAERNWESLSPEQRQVFKNQVLPKWQQMTPERRQLVIGRLHTLQGMTPAQRDAALKDPRFMQGLTPDEQDVLRDLNSPRNPNSQ